MSGKAGRCEFLNIIAWLTLILQSNRAESSVSPISFKIETVTFCWDAPAGPSSLQQFEKFSVGPLSAPEIVAKGFDDMIGSDTQVRRSLFDHLQHAAQHTDDSPKWPLLAFGDTTE